MVVDYETLSGVIRISFWIQKELLGNWSKTGKESVIVIESIELNDCTPYQKAEMSGCKKINFIFGANGSGKSTISSFLSGADVPRFAKSLIHWSSERHEHVEVYDAKFRRANLQQEIQGVFTIGSDAIEDKQKLKNLNEELDKQNKNLEKYSNEIKQKEEEKESIELRFRDDAWQQILKKNETDFSTAFDGLRGSKIKFLDELKKRIENPLGKVFDRQALLQRAQAVFAPHPEKLTYFSVDFGNYVQVFCSIQNDKIWGMVVSGSADVDIASLIKELGNSSWVSQGLQYIKQDSQRCPFCQQETITEDFRYKLELFFDANYQHKINQMKALCDRYKDNATKLIGALETTIKNNASSAQIGKLDEKYYLSKKDLLNKTLEHNIQLIETKIEEPEKRIVLADVTTELQELKDLLAGANALIAKHNRLIDAREAEATALRNDIWVTCIHAEEVLVKNYKKDVENVDKALSNLRQKKETAQSEIAELEATIEKTEKGITSVKPSITKINELLKTYGFTNFSLQPAANNENCYCIKRDDGTSASNTLSEGEATFLTFLYFMQRIEGSTERNPVPVKKVVVIDDPISSLDNTILYVVSAIVKDLAEKVKKGEGDVVQLFVLTHNVLFHKEVSLDWGNKNGKEVNYWIVRKNNGISSITSYQQNPISSSYALLWDELRNEKSSMASVRNSMRRIIENYFKVIGKIPYDQIINNFSTVEEKLIVKSLFSWMNEGSHGIPDDFFDDSYNDSRERYKEIFRRIFFESGHIAHYNMMMCIDDSEEKGSSDENEKRNTKGDRNT